IIPKIVGVGVLTQRNTSAKNPRLRVIDIDHAIACVGHEQFVQYRNVKRSLGLVQPHNGLYVLTLEIIDDLYGIVTQPGKHCEPTFWIESEVINATRDTRQGHFRSEDEGRTFPPRDR